MRRKLPSDWQNLKFIYLLLLFLDQNVSKTNNFLSLQSKRKCVEETKCTKKKQNSQYATKQTKNIELIKKIKI